MASAGRLLHAAWSDVVHSPWTAVGIGVVVLIGIAFAVRALLLSGPRDPMRRFPRDDRQLLLERAGHRCEHHSLFGERCTASVDLEVEHVHPHSRGGWTHVSNGRVVCRQHSRAEASVIPFGLSLNRLAARRSDYYPAGVDTSITRRDPGTGRPPAHRLARTGARRAAG